MGHLLGLIVERGQELMPSEPPVMLSALVTYLGENDPGPGFYQLAKEMDLLPAKASPEQKFCFWTEQVKRLYARHGGGPAVARG
ncbi:hypothetical protein ACPCIY_04655 [Streptomyces thermodiastaticus]